MVRFFSGWIPPRVGSYVCVPRSAVRLGGHPERSRGQLLLLGRHLHHRITVAITRTHCLTPSILPALCIGIGNEQMLRASNLECGSKCHSRIQLAGACNREVARWRPRLTPSEDCDIKSEFSRSPLSGSLEGRQRSTCTAVFLSQEQYQILGI